MTATPTYDRLRANGYDHSGAVDVLISDIRRQFPLWTSTFNPCPTDGCRNRSRGSGPCAECLAVELGTVTDPHDARTFLIHTELASRAAAQLFQGESLLSRRLQRPVGRQLEE